MESEYTDEEPLTTNSLRGPLDTDKVICKQNEFDFLAKTVFAWYEAPTGPLVISLIYSMYMYLVMHTFHIRHIEYATD